MVYAGSVKSGLRSFGEGWSEDQITRFILSGEVGVAKALVGQVDSDSDSHLAYRTITHVPYNVQTTPDLKFHALVTETGTERLELAKASGDRKGKGERSGVHSPRARTAEMVSLRRLRPGKHSLPTTTTRG
jgi:hypothetical protein